MSKMPQLDKPIFIIGLHRTGSTLLKNTLGKNSMVAMATDEMDLADPWHQTFMDHYRKSGDLRNELLLKKFIDLLFSGAIHGSFWRDLKSLELSRKDIEDKIGASDLSAKSIISILLDEYRKKVNRPRVGVKYPLHFSRVGILRGWFPDAKIIFLTRDIRAICASKINDEASRERVKKLKLLGFIVRYFTLSFFLMEFIWFSKVFRKYKNQTNVRLVRYEELVLEPERCLTEICQFCEIPVEQTMFTAFGKPSSFTGEIQAGFDRSRVRNWKNHLNKFENWLITFITRPSMHKLGYGSEEF